MRNNAYSLPSSPRGGKVFKNSRYGASRPQRRQNQGQYIDPQKFINQATTPQQEEVFVPVHRFTDFGFIKPLEQNVVAKGYETPTPIQDSAIEPVMKGRDFIGLANTGTGKTAAFVLPMIQRLKTDLGDRTTLIIAPTRELASQIDDEFRAFARGLNLYSTLCVGGLNISRQISQLNRRPQVIIGTPGRLKDLYMQRALNLSRTGIVVLDEADRMLDMGFIQDIRFLLDKLPVERQSLCFSATITPEIQRLLDTMLKDPVSVSVKTSVTSDHVEQDIIRAGSKEEKFAILLGLLRKPDFGKVLIFGRTKWGVQRLADDLSREGFSAEAIHGNKSQPQRQRALKAFKENRVNILVATDVAARGLDIPLVSHVINFDQPTTYDDYVHRIGRTGRAGNRGKALTFVG